MARDRLFSVVWLVGLILLSACSSIGGNGTVQPTSGPALFRPPTLINTEISSVTQVLSPTASPARVDSTPHVTATAPCNNNLTFESDLTIPDGSDAQPGTSLDKRWQVKNAGSCNWDDRYSLRLVDGDSLGIDPEQLLYPARAGSDLSLRLVFTAPQEPGTYRSAWQAYSPDGDAFGDPVYIEIAVK